VYDATNDSSMSVRRAAVAAIAPIMNVWHENADVLQRAWAHVFPRLMDNESAVADAALDICNDVIRCILPPLVKTDPASAAVAWRQLCAISTQQHYQLSRAVALLCKKGSLTRAAVAPILSRIIQHEAGSTPPSLLVVAQQLVQAFPLQDGDVMLPQMVSRSLALCFADDDVTVDKSESENERGGDAAVAAREEAALMLQMVAALADAVPKGTANQLACALLQVMNDLWLHCVDSGAGHAINCANHGETDNICLGTAEGPRCLRLHRSCSRAVGCACARVWAEPEQRTR
jgi:hypothetical protein